MWVFQDEKFPKLKRAEGDVWNGGGLCISEASRNSKTPTLDSPLTIHLCQKVRTKQTTREVGCPKYQGIYHILVRNIILYLKCMMHRGLIVKFSDARQPANQLVMLSDEITE